MQSPAVTCRRLPSLAITYRHLPLQVPLDSYIALEREMALVYDPRGEMPADEPVQIAHKLMMDVATRGSRTLDASPTRPNRVLST